MGDLNLTVLSNTLKILEICTKRGAFKPEELEIVGSTYTSLKNFVDLHVSKLKKPETETENVADTEETANDNSEANEDAVVNENENSVKVV